MDPLVDQPGKSRKLPFLHPGEYQIQGGRWFRSTELTRLVKLGIIETPAYHAVSRLRGGQETGYMRADPDNALVNNLAELFA